jgi:toxin ParE1/3/4
MRHLKVEYRPEAFSDLEAIYRYIWSRSQNKSTAREFVRRIKKRCSKIGLVPHRGSPRNELEPGLRMVPFERSAVILYRVEADRVRVTNVFYGGRDYETLFLGMSEQDSERESEY